MSPTVFFLAAATIYLVPGLIAVMRRRRDQMLIVASNILFGWTVLGWVGSLLWALRTPKPKLQKSQAKPEKSAAFAPPRSESRRQRAEPRSRFQWDDLGGRDQYAAWLDRGEARGATRSAAGR